jgi:hypothetical protein
MIKGYIYSIALLTSITLLLTSCGEKEEEIELHTPEFNMISSIDNHAVIFSYDFMKLMDKSKVQNSEDMPMEVKMAMSLYLGNMLKSSNMGIRLEGNNHTVITTTDNGEIDFGILTAEVVNEDKIKKGIKDFFKGKAFEEDGLHFIKHKFSQTLAAWDSDHIIFIYSENDTIDLKTKAKSILDARKIEGAENAVLENYLEREDDINVIVYLDKWMELAKKETEDIELDEEFLNLYDESYMFGAGNFLEGKIVFEMEMHGDKLKDSKYNLLPGNPISNEFMSYLSNEDPLMFGVASINMDAVFDVMLQNHEMKDEFKAGVKEIGWTEKEMKGLFTGEFSASLVEIEMKPNPYYELQASLMADDFFAEMEESYVPNPSEIPSPVYLVTIGLNDPDKLKALFTTLHMIENKGGYFTAGSDGFFVFSDDKLMITSDESIAATLGSGKKLKEYTPASEINSSLYAEISPDVDDLPQALQDMILENGGNASEGLLEFMNDFEKVTFSGSFDKMKMEVIMTDKAANSIEVITGKLMKQVIQNMSLFI